jgi:hypothetical protein
MSRDGPALCDVILCVFDPARLDLFPYPLSNPHPAGYGRYPAAGKAALDVSVARYGPDL